MKLRISDGLSYCRKGLQEEAGLQDDPMAKWGQLDDLIKAAVSVTSVQTIPVHKDTEKDE